MEKKVGLITYKDSIKDIFPYVESTIIKLDNNLSWWKKNYEILEDKLANIISGIIDSPIDIVTRFTIYNGTDDNVESVKWSSPAIEFIFLESSSNVPKKIRKELGNSWEGHRILSEDNKLFILFE